MKNVSMNFTHSTKSASIPTADKPNEYHHIEVRLDQRALTARTNDGYYANPKFIQPER